MPNVETRIQRRAEERSRLYGYHCDCSCGCPTMHRFYDRCALCRRGDHWDVIVKFLNRVMA